MRQAELHYPSDQRAEGRATAGYSYQLFFNLVVAAMGPKPDAPRDKDEKSGKGAYLMHIQDLDPRSFEKAK